VDPRPAKELLRHRFLLLRFRTAVRNSLGALLRKRNLQPPTKKLFTRGGRAYLEQVELNAEAQRIRENSLALLGQQDKMIGQLDWQLQRQVKHDPITTSSTPRVG